MNYWLNMNAKRKWQNHNKITKTKMKTANIKIKPS